MVDYVQLSDPVYLRKKIIKILHGTTKERVLLRTEGPFFFFYRRSCLAMRGL